MPNIYKANFLDAVKKRYNSVKKLNSSLSLFEIEGSNVRIYIRYSKVHNDYRLFFGLRKEDLKLLEGFPSLICFLWDNQIEPLFIIYSDYEEIFNSISPASDGQYKLQIYLEANGIELYFPRTGKFNIESNVGWQLLDNLLESSSLVKIPDLSHSQIQTLLGSIGNKKGFDIWIPPTDRNKLDWEIADPFHCVNSLPNHFRDIKNVLQEVDVLWFDRGANVMNSLFEVEHSTPIYSGLLRFNDIHLTNPHLKPKFSIVSNDARRSLFIKQLNRPTFQVSGLYELCSFLEYVNVYSWFNRVKSQKGK
jgi:hypothetical protein